MFSTCKGKTKVIKAEHSWALKVNTSQKKFSKEKKLKENTGPNDLKYFVRSRYALSGGGGGRSDYLVPLQNVTDFL